MMAWNFSLSSIQSSLCTSSRTSAQTTLVAQIYTINKENFKKKLYYFVEILHWFGYYIFVWHVRIPVFRAINSWDDACTLGIDRVQFGLVFTPVQWSNNVKHMFENNFFCIFRLLFELCSNNFSFLRIQALIVLKYSNRHAYNLA